MVPRRRRTRKRHRTNRGALHTYSATAANFFIRIFGGPRATRRLPRGEILCSRLRATTILGGNAVAEWLAAWQVCILPQTTDDPREITCEYLRTQVRASRIPARRVAVPVAPGAPTRRIDLLGHCRVHRVSQQRRRRGSRCGQSRHIGCGTAWSGYRKHRTMGLPRWPWLPVRR